MKIDDVDLRSTARILGKSSQAENEITQMVEWRGSNKDEIDQLFTGTKWVPKYYGRMNAVRLAIATEGESEISIGMYDKVFVDADQNLWIERHRWGR